MELSWTHFGNVYRHLRLTQQTIEDIITVGTMNRGGIKPKFAAEIFEKIVKELHPSDQVLNYIFKHYDMPGLVLREVIKFLKDNGYKVNLHRKMLLCTSVGSVSYSLCSAEIEELLDYWMRFSYRLYRRGNLKDSKEFSVRMFYYIESCYHEIKSEFWKIFSLSSQLVNISSLCEETPDKNSMYLKKKLLSILDKVDVEKLKSYGMDSLLPQTERLLLQL